MVAGVALDGAVEDLGRQIVDGAEARVGDLVAGVDRQPKVGELDLQARRQQDVLRLDVAVDDAEAVDVRQGAHCRLEHDGHGGGLGQAAAALLQEREDVALRRPLEREVDRVGVLPRGVQRDDAGVAQLDVQPDLARDLVALHVGQRRAAVRLEADRHAGRAVHRAVHARDRAGVEPRAHLERAERPLAARERRGAVLGDGDDGALGVGGGGAVAAGAGVGRLLLLWQRRGRRLDLGLHLGDHLALERRLIAWRVEAASHRCVFSCRCC